MFPLYEWPEKPTQPVQPLLILSNQQNPYSSIESLFLLSFIDSKTHHIQVSSRHECSPRKLLPMLVTKEGKMISGHALVEYILESCSVKGNHDPFDFLTKRNLLFKLIVLLMDHKSRGMNEKDFRIYKQEYSWPLNLLVYKDHQRKLKSFLSAHLVNSTLQDLLEESIQVIDAFSKLLGKSDYFGGKSPNLVDAYAWATFYYLSKTDLPSDSPLKKSWDECQNLIEVI